jgi:NTP pyrophosphatase (non-canonical NTP hydrolase)
MNIETTQERLRQFRDERDWQRFHTPQNLAQALSVEAGELLECFLWGEERVEELDHVAEECADVMIYLLQLTDACDVDLETAVRMKMECNAARFPVQPPLFGEGRS